MKTSPKAENLTILKKYGIIKMRSVAAGGYTKKKLEPNDSS